MKKLLLTLTAVAMAFTASALNWYVCGAFQGWNAGTAPQMVEQEDGTFVLEVATIQSGFKIINAQGWGQGEWGAPSAQDKVVLGEPFILTDNGGQDISFKDYEVINNAKLVLNPTNTTLTITGTPNTDNPELWLPGGYAPSNWATPEVGSATPQFTENDGIYTLITIFNGEFECKVTGSGWAPQWGFYSSVPVMDDNNKTAILDKKEGNDPGNIKCNFTGEYTVTFNIETREITFTSTSGIEDTIIIENETPAYYNMQGVKVDNPANGLYIQVLGNKASKVYKK